MIIGTRTPVQLGAVIELFWNPVIFQFIEPPQQVSVIRETSAKEFIDFWEASADWESFKDIRELLGEPPIDGWYYYEVTTD